MPAARRPHFPPEERLAILELRAARGWTVQQTAEAFFVSEATIRNWMKCLDEDGKDALIKPRFAINRLPDFIRNIVRAAGAKSAAVRSTAHR